MPAARCLVNLDNLSVKHSFSLHLMKLTFVLIHVYFLPNS